MELIGWFGCFVVCIAFLVVIFLIYMDGFQNLRQEITGLETQYFVIKQFKGPYSSIHKASDIFDSILLRTYDKSYYSSNTYVFYNSDPRNEEDEELIWCLGIEIDKETFLEKKSPELTYIQIPQCKVLMYKYIYRNHISYMIGAQKCFKSLSKAIEKNHLTPTLPPVENHNIEKDPTYIKYYIYLNDISVDFELERYMQL